MSAERKIKKHVAIIHAYSLMSSLQRKVVNVLLHEAIVNKSPDDNINSVALERRISFANLAKKVNFNSNNTQYLKEAIDQLANLKIEWNLLKDKVPTDISFLNLRILHGAPTFYHDGTFNFSFHKIMLNFVDNPAIYGLIDLDLQSQFESKYGHSLYENSTRFVSLHKNKVIHLDLFRRLLGVREDKYESMRELTRNVIKPAVEEVNDRADFVVSLEPIKMGKKVTAFELFVDSKKISKPQKIENDSNKNHVVMNEIKRTFSELTEANLINIINNYPEEYILEKLAYTKKYAKKDKSGNYPIPYFISALKFDYKTTQQNDLTMNQSTPIINNDVVWKEKLLNLNSELMHWQRQIEYAKAINKESYLDEVQAQFFKCENNLKQHLLERPTSDKEITLV